MSNIYHTVVLHGKVKIVPRKKEFSQTYSNPKAPKGVTQSTIKKALKTTVRPVFPPQKKQ